MRLDSVVPVRAGSVAFDVDARELGLAHVDASLVLVLVKGGRDRQPALGPSRPDEIDHWFVTTERLALPAQTNAGEQPVLNLVPLACPGRIVTDRNRDGDLVREALQVQCPRSVVLILDNPGQATRTAFLRGRSVSSTAGPQRLLSRGQDETNFTDH